MRRIRFVPLAALLGALTLLCALPALASAVENENEAGQNIGTGQGNGGCSSGGLVDVDVGSQCGNSGSQEAEQEDVRNGIIQQCQALRDCNQQAIQQEINNNRFTTTNTTRQAGPGGAAAQDGADTQGAAATQGSSQGTQATAVHRAETPDSAAVREVTLARTGFDTWILFAVGGASVAAGLGFLAVRRWNLTGLLGRDG